MVGLSLSAKRELSMARAASEMPDLPNQHHFARFGAIIHSFARIEHLIQGTIAAVSGIDDGKLVVVTKSMNYSQKRDTLYSYLVIDNYAADKATKIRELFDEAHKFNSLRNCIAHALWVKGARPRSIRPQYVDVRYGKGRLIGFEDDDRDYTMDELGDAANSLRRITNKIIRYLRDSGIAPAVAARVERVNQTGSSPEEAGK
jgi:hypothetical protein